MLKCCLIMIFWQFKYGKQQIFKLLLKLYGLNVVKSKPMANTLTKIIMTKKNIEFILSIYGKQHILKLLVKRYKSKIHCRFIHKNFMNN